LQSLIHISVVNTIITQNLAVLLLQKYSIQRSYGGVLRRTAQNTISNWEIPSMILELNRTVRQAVRRALWAGGAFAAGLAAQSAQAQTAPTRLADADDNAPPLTEVVVTGSRISNTRSRVDQSNYAISSEEIKQTGTTRVEDLINSLPQVVADQGSGLSMGSTGIATINLRDSVRSAHWC